MSQGVTRTSLTPYAAQMRDPDENRAHKLAARLWHDEGAIIIRAPSIARLDWQDRELLTALATKLYGKRETK